MMNSTNHKTRKDELSFWEHIRELRSIIIRSIVVLLFSVSIIHYFHKEIIIFLLQPLGDNAPTLQFLSPLDPLYFILTIDFVFGSLLALPVIFFLLWQYISPAVHIRWWVPLTFISIVMLLTVTATIYSYMLVTPIVLHFMSSIVIPGTTVAFTAKGYLSFFIATTLILILIFQIPIIMYLLSALHLISIQAIEEKRPYIYLSIIVISAILTPTTDVLTLALVSAPGMLAVELGIIASKIFVEKPPQHASL